MPLHQRPGLDSSFTAVLGDRLFEVPMTPPRSHLVTPTPLIVETEGMKLQALARRVETLELRVAQLEHTPWVRFTVWWTETWIRVTTRMRRF